MWMYHKQFNLENCIFFVRLYTDNSIFNAYYKLSMFNKIINTNKILIHTDFSGWLYDPLLRPV